MTFKLNKFFVKFETVLLQGPFLLTHLLMDVLIAGNSPSRIVTLSSRGHKHGGGIMNFDDLMMETDFSSMYAYAQSKLANILFTRELANRLRGTALFYKRIHFPHLHDIIQAVM